MIDLQAIQERLEAAINAEGPFTMEKLPNGNWTFPKGSLLYYARTDIAALIDEVKRLRAALEETRGFLCVVPHKLGEYVEATGTHWELGEDVHIGVGWAEDMGDGTFSVPNLAAYLKERPSPPGKP